ncbi:YkgJ family cysteine cluster protein [Geomonas sp. Red69]|uniref:YkgJ family cysteine cluster protein n=1 Tax=Geomonas diazotrophica TaxID=2843197 RepID=A0ABX8JMR3_9BACT|nr:MULTISPECIES: YkgJ family cysteine cluster protein [Geomonas]MBU5635730.1 YkgJ family cysteine cluster protein [Geomonas diazotrophica]QWV99665.1 YkgJ family cysteine cluster protein [Geomonas nitrogeniifigens]QXE88802.1 YkgJ family cysteine cluster protein [Geomonas nitrogeniifigens]
MQCSGCGTCCVAPDISSLDKKVGERCRHLSGEQRCLIYDERPAVCRGYRPDEMCGLIAAPTLEERVANYLGLFGLQPD